MRVTQRMMVNNFLSNIAANTEQLANLQDQLASGKRLRKPSDDPQALNRALTIKVSSDQNTQYLRNISLASGWLSATDSTLGNMEDTLIQARDIGLRGLSNTIGSDERASLAKQVDGKLEEFVQSANSTYQGSYLFSGRMVTTSPFTPVRTNGEITSVAGSYRAGDAYNPATSGGQVSREVANGVDVVVNVAGDQTVAGNVPIQQGMQALMDLRDWLNNPASGSANVNQISTALDGLSSLRSTVGTQVQRVDNTENLLNGENVNLASLLSQAQDADVAAVMTKLATQQTVYQASLQAGAKVLQRSLLDYLG
jgi:flagellar hook-associated protein 3 FlgL